MVKITTYNKPMHSNLFSYNIYVTSNWESHGLKQAQLANFFYILHPLMQHTGKCMHKILLIYLYKLLFDK